MFQQGDLVPVRHEEAAVQARADVDDRFGPAAQALELREGRVRQVDRRERQLAGGRCERLERDVETSEVDLADALEAVPERVGRMRRRVLGPVDAALVLPHAGVPTIAPEAMATATPATASSQRLAGERGAEGIFAGAGFRRHRPAQRHSQASPRTGSAIVAVTRRTSGSGACSQATQNTTYMPVASTARTLTTCPADQSSTPATLFVPSTMVRRMAISHNGTRSIAIRRSRKLTHSHPRQARRTGQCGNVPGEADILVYQVRVASCRPGQGAPSTRRTVLPASRLPSEDIMDTSPVLPPSAAAVGVSFDGRAYHYREYSYDRLADALGYARRTGPGRVSREDDGRHATGSNGPDRRRTSGCTWRRTVSCTSTGGIVMARIATICCPAASRMRSTRRGSPGRVADASAHAATRFSFRRPIHKNTLRIIGTCARKERIVCHLHAISSDRHPSRQPRCSAHRAPRESSLHPASRIPDSFTF